MPFRRARRCATGFPALSRSPGRLMKNIASIEDLRQLARRRVPRAFFDYADSGSYNEETLRANRADLERSSCASASWSTSPARSLATTILGEKVAAPLALAPDRAVAACSTATARSWPRARPRRPASRSRSPPCRSARSRTSPRRPASRSGSSSTSCSDRGFIQGLIERAAAAKCSALVLTVDLQVLGQRHRDMRNGMTVPPEITLTNLIDIATKPAWALEILNGKRKTFGNLAGHVKGMENVNSLAHGPRASSIRRCPGRTSSGSRASGPAS